MSKRENEPPPGPAPDSTPVRADGPCQGMRTVCFEGKVQLFVSDMPEASFVDLSRAGTHPVFACCWIDRHRGKSSFVEFPTGSGVGVFRVELELRDGDPDKLKVQLSMRMRDSQTGNRRTVPLTTSCANINPMLAGRVDEMRMPDQFISSNFANVSMRIVNSQDFVSRPLVLSASKLDQIADLNKHVRRVSEEMEANNVKNNTKFLKGTDSMRSGDSRCLPWGLVFLALALGTPAYAFLVLQS